MGQKLKEGHRQCKRKWDCEKDEMSKWLRIAEQVVTILKRSLRETTVSGQCKKELKERIVSKMQGVIFFVIGVF